MQKFLFLFVSLLILNQVKSQSIKLASGIEFRYAKKGKSTQTPKVGDYAAMVIKSTCSGQLLFDSKTYNKGSNGPVNFPVQKPNYNGDVNEVIRLLHEGDSVVVYIPQDSFYRVPQAQRKGIKAGDPVVYNIALYSIKTVAQLKKIQDDYKKQMDAFAKQQADFKKQQAQQLALQKKQAAIDKKQDQEMLSYFAKNNIGNAKKLPSGLYVAIDSAGEGDLIKPGFEVTMNYESQSLIGIKFDSNTDTTFKHVTPMKTTIGQRQLFPGWEEGMQQFKKGSKGKIFVPSKFAYGSSKFGLRANDTIPANTVVRLDIDVLEVTDVATVAKQLIDKEDAEIQAFLKANNFTATKTASGLYYVITKEGEGDKPAVGDEVSMNYTGMFLDGKKFDSNVDSSFNHVQPLTFPLGQGRVIRGWVEGIQLLKKGTKAKFIIPSAIGYGAAGSGTIPANTVMQFDVELLDFKKAVDAVKPVVQKK